MRLLGRAPGADGRLHVDRLRPPARGERPGRAGAVRERRRAGAGTRDHRHPDQRAVAGDQGAQHDPGSGSDAQRRATSAAWSSATG